MLPSNIIYDETAIERLICKVLDEEIAKGNYVSYNDSPKIGTLLLLIQTNIRDSKEFIEDLKKDTFFNNLLDLFKFNFDVTIKDEYKFLSFIGLLSDNFITLKIYSIYIQYYCKKNNIKVVDINLLVNEILPFGTFKDETLMEIYYSTKILVKDFSSDNLIDYNIPYKSILFN